MLSKEAIRQYQQIFKKMFGEEISEAEALEAGTRLIELFKVLYTSKDQKKFRKEDQVAHQKPAIPERAEL